MSIRGKGYVTFGHRNDCTVLVAFSLTRGIYVRKFESEADTGMKTPALVYLYICIEENLSMPMHFSMYSGTFMHALA